MRKAVCTFVLTLAAIFVVASSAMAQTYPPSPQPLTISSSTAPAGGTLTISGEGADPGATVIITFASDPVVVATTTADAEGAFSATFQVPESAEPGTHTVSAISNGVVLATVEVRVTAAAQSSESELAFTGLNLLLKVGVGVGMLVAGAALLLAIRRRRAAPSA
jgi:hypothetical protein